MLDSSLDALYHPERYCERRITSDGYNELTLDFLQNRYFLRNVHMGREQIEVLITPKKLLKLSFEELVIRQ